MIWRAKFIGLSKTHILVFLEHSKCNLMQYHGYCRQIHVCANFSNQSWSACCAENKINELFVQEKESLITELRKELRVSDEEHRELLNKVNEDGTIRRMRLHNNLSVCTCFT
jgi:hypothetical protein